MCVWPPVARCVNHTPCTPLVHSFARDFFCPSPAAVIFHDESKFPLSPRVFTSVSPSHRRSKPTDCVRCVFLLWRCVCQGWCGGGNSCLMCVCECAWTTCTGLPSIQPPAPRQLPPPALSPTSTLQRTAEKSPYRARDPELAVVVGGPCSHLSGARLVSHSDFSAFHHTHRWAASATTCSLQAKHLACKPHVASCYMWLRF